MYMRDVGQRIRWARKSAGLNQTELANAVGVTVGAVSHWETGKSKNLKNRHLYAVAEKTGVSAKWLVTGEGDPIREDIGSVEARKIADLIMQLSPAQRAAILSLVDEMPKRTEKSNVVNGD